MWLKGLMVCISLVRHSQKIHNQFSDSSSLTGHRHLCLLYSSKIVSRNTQKSQNSHIEWVWIHNLWRNKKGSLPTLNCCSLGKSYSCSFTGAWCLVKRHHANKSSSSGALWCADFLSVFSPGFIAARLQTTSDQPELRPQPPTAQQETQATNHFPGTGSRPICIMRHDENKYRALNTTMTMVVTLCLSEKPTRTVDCKARLSWRSDKRSWLWRKWSHLIPFKWTKWCWALSVTLAHTSVEVQIFLSLTYRYVKFSLSLCRLYIYIYFI